MTSPTRRSVTELWRLIGSDLNAIGEPLTPDRLRSHAAVLRTPQHPNRPITRTRLERAEACEAVADLMAGDTPERAP